MRVKNITVTVSVRVSATVRVSLVLLFCINVSVRVSVTVRVSLVLFVTSNTFGVSSVAICRRSFVCSLLRSGVQPTLDPSAETFISVQCASPGRGGELIGVCGVCASCVGWRNG